MIKDILTTCIRKLKYLIYREGGIIEYELLYGQIWRDVVEGVEWLNKGKKLLLFPGRWAIGYNTMYVLVRILNDTKPRNVLEFGLGNSSRIIAKYFENTNQDGAEKNHFIIEHNKSWIEFINKENVLSDYSRIFQTNLDTKRYKGKGITAYKDISPVMNIKYDLILIDGPLGSEGRYSRMDILEYLPECLNDSFAIIIDDYNRSGERGLAREIEACLKKHGIEYAKGIYLGEREAFVICSENYSFLATM